MENEALGPQWEKVLEKTRLKEPPDALMKDYLSQVHQKIDRRHSSWPVGQPILGCIVVGALALAVAAFLFLKPEPTREVAPVASVAIEPFIRPVVQRSETAPSKSGLSVEDQMAILEAFGEEIEDEIVDLLGDEELAVEAAFLDETELRLLQKAASPGA